MVPSLDEVDMLFFSICLCYLLFLYQLVYMLLCQLSKDMHDENEDISYTWVREYLWDVCTLAQCHLSKI